VMAGIIVIGILVLLIGVVALIARSRRQ